MRRRPPPSPYPRPPLSQKFHRMHCKARLLHQRDPRALRALPPGGGRRWRRGLGLGPGPGPAAKAGGGAGAPARLQPRRLDDTLVGSMTAKKKKKKKKKMGGQRRSSPSSKSSPRICRRSVATLCRTTTQGLVGSRQAPARLQPLRTPPRPGRFSEASRRRRRRRDAEERLRWRRRRRDAEEAFSEALRWRRRGGGVQ